MDPLPSFSFNENVANVFDNMIKRSVPCYKETQQLIANTVINFYKEGSVAYDLGCSTGETFKTILKLTNQPMKMIGIDSSEPMIKKAKEKCTNNKSIEFICDDILNVEFQPTSVVVLTYVLQFMQITDRLELLKKINKAMLPSGAMIIFEKIYSQEFKEEFIELHELFKEQQGYSKMEVKQKRKALEDVLVPMTYEENKKLLEDAGFTKVEKCFQYLNFCGILVTK